MTQASQHVRGQRKVLAGLVLSNKMQKTIVVRVIRKVRHPKYSRVTDQASTFKAHDEANSAAIGDWVTITETRPLSKDKRWRLVDIIKRASDVPPLPGDEIEPASPAANAPPASREVGG